MLQWFLVTRQGVWFWGILGLLVALSRFVHSGILWSDEDYHLAAAIQMLHGKMLYRDLWFDKPPGAALLPLLWGAYPGWPLRLAGTLLVLASVAVAYRFASSLWAPREGYLAAALLAFAQIFYFAPGVIPLEPDTWMVLPHLLSIYWAWRGRAFASGLAAGIAFTLSPKGGLVLLAALAVQPSGWLPMLAGFAIPNGVVLLWLAAGGALGDYFEQLWSWGLRYASSPSDRVAPVLRLGTWAGLSAALVLGAMRVPAPSRKRIAIWLGISAVGVLLGWRMSPRYFNQVLPALAIAAAGGWSVWLRSRTGIAAFAMLLAIPVVRFAPRYFELGGQLLAGQPHTWADTALDRESLAAAASIRRIAQPGDTLFVWGYRPNIVVYTRLPVASRLWESQPLTGVPADRHLNSSLPIDPERARLRRQELIRTTPSLIADGLSSLNPDLDIRSYPDLAEWFGHYCRVDAAGAIAIYRRCR